MRGAGHRRCRLLVSFPNMLIVVETIGDRLHLDQWAKDF